jgi:hypothetical protein
LSYTSFSLKSILSDSRIIVSILIWLLFAWIYFYFLLFLAYFFFFRPKGSVLYTYTQFMRAELSQHCTIEHALSPLFMFSLNLFYKSFFFLLEGLRHCYFAVCVSYSFTLCSADFFFFKVVAHLDSLLTWFCIKFSDILSVVTMKL